MYRYIYICVCMTLSTSRRRDSEQAGVSSIASSLEALPPGSSLPCDCRSRSLNAENTWSEVLC